MNIYGISRDNSFERSVPFNDYLALGTVYLHGKAELVNGYDLCYLVQPDETGVYGCILHACDGNEYDAILYYWLTSSKHKRGYVVLKNDIEAQRHAECKYRRKAVIL